MKLDFSNERILAVMAHPDDAELLCAGTMARARAEGAEIGICVLAKGDKGQPARPIRNLAAHRRKEMLAAAHLIGAKLFTADFSDGELMDDRQSRLRLIEIYRQFQPTLVLAHDPEDYHPDHRAASALAESASWFCASRGNKTRSAPLAAAPAVWFADTINMTGFQVGFYVDISAYAEVKERMLGCHLSQIARGTDGDFSPLLEMMRVQCRARGLQAGVAAAETFRTCRTFKRARAW